MFSLKKKKLSFLFSLFLLWPHFKSVCYFSVPKKSAIVVCPKPIKSIGHHWKRFERFRCYSLVRKKILKCFLSEFPLCLIFFLLFFFFFTVEFAFIYAIYLYFLQNKMTIFRPEFFFLNQSTFFFLALFSHHFFFCFSHGLLTL